MTNAPTTHRIRRTIGIAAAASIAVLLAAPAAGARPIPAPRIPVVTAVPPASRTGTVTTLFGDVNNDRRTDVVAVNRNDRVVVSLAQSGYPTYKDPTYWTEIPAYGDRTTALADVTGDGRADLVIVNDNGVVVRRSDGTRFGANEVWAGAFYGSHGTYFADVTGDRRADAIVVNETGIVVRPANLDATGFLGNENWAWGQYWGSSGRVEFADVNDDGRADLITQNFLNNDTGAVMVRWATDHHTFDGLQYWTCTTGCGHTWFADLARSVPGVEQLRWTQSGFQFFDARGGSSTPYMGQCPFLDVDFTFADWNGDGRADYIQVNPSKIVVHQNVETTFVQLDPCVPWGT